MIILAPYTLWLLIVYIVILIIHILHAQDVYIYSKKATHESR